MTDVQRTQTFILKSKTAKTATPTPVVVITFESAKENGSSLGKKLKLKDSRVASDDMLQNTFKATKDTISPWVLSNVEDLSLVRLVIDADLVDVMNNKGDTALSFPVSNKDKDNVVVDNKTANELKAFLEGLKKDYESVDFKSVVIEKPKDSAEAAKTPKQKASAKVDNQIEELNQMGLQYKKNTDFPKWYTEVLTKSEMLDYYDVSGCYILRPLAYNVWKEITNFFDKEITEMGIDDTYFPMFVSNTALEREKDHIDGFAPEVAWVTKAGGSDLEEPIAIRPTSEAVMYPYFAKWIQSHRDLPLRINQWCSVVRWEFKHPQPFLRTREFLWQEGHTAHLTKGEADKEVWEILELYYRVYRELLAVPVIKGQKSEKERFAGGKYTTTVEGFIPTTGRAIQGGTSHSLGQNFSKMFDITVEDPNEEAKKLHVWQNSWGLSTRTIGVMVMVHGDDKGLVMPPRVAQWPTVVIPCGITKKTTKKEKDTLMSDSVEIARRLKVAGIKCKADVRENYTPGFKFNYYELRGVPLRIEYGPQDKEKKQVTCVRRDLPAKTEGARFAVPLDPDTLETGIREALDTIQKEMLERAEKKMNESIARITKWEEFVPALNAKKMCLMPWCDRMECEDDIKERSARRDDDENDNERAPSMGAKSLCSCRPDDEPKDDPIVPGVTKCVACGKDAKHYMYFGRSY